MSIGSLALRGVRTFGAAIGKSKGKLSIAKLSLRPSLTGSDQKAIIKSLVNFSTQKSARQLNKITILENKATSWGNFADSLNVPEGSFVDNIAQGVQFIGKGAPIVASGAKNAVNSKQLFYEKTLMDYYRKIGVTIRTKSADRFELLKNAEGHANNIMDESSLIKDFLGKAQGRLSAIFA